MRVTLPFSSMLLLKIILSLSLSIASFLSASQKNSFDEKENPFHFLLFIFYFLGELCFGVDEGQN